MRNQPFNSIFDDGGSSNGTLIDPPASVRFRALAATFVVAAIIVLARIGWVQAKLQDRYLAALTATTTEYEVIPARDGRILSESSDVFATDIDQYSVQIHYRWLQEPINSTWLNRQVRTNLTRSERRNADTVAGFEATIIQQRQQMWSELITSVGLTADEFNAKQLAIQKKVTRIADSVNRRRQQQTVPTATEVGDGLVMKIASAIRSALTTTPRRKLIERIVVREEESYHEIVADIPLEIAGSIRERAHLFPGVRVVAGNRRTYPLESVAAHVVGARTQLKDDEETSLPTTTALDSGSWTPRCGRFGVERSYNHQLQSVPGLRRIERSRRQEIVASEIERQPVSGRDIVLTLNSELQKYAERLLAESLMDKPATLLSDDQPDSGPQSTPQPIPTGGCVVVMEVATGRLLTAASAPTFPLSLYTGATEDDWEIVNQDKRHPFLSRLTSMAIPPGSVMKPLTAVAAIESGGLNPDAPFHCQGYLTQPNEHRCLIFRRFGYGHDEITLSRAIAQSCNVYFFSAAEKMGFAPLRNWCDRFGLGRKTGVDLPFERNGHLPGSINTNAETNQRFRREVLGLAIGQSSVAVTPLQMIRVMAAIANGGWLVTPHIVSPDGTARTTNDIDDRPRDIMRRRITGLHDGTLERIQEGLTAVVQQPYGTGYKNVRLNNVPIAGKTGTAETGGGRPDHAWFAGYVPADDPQYAIVVVLEHGGSGSRTAGPVVRQLVRKMNTAKLLR